MLLPSSEDHNQSAAFATAIFGALPVTLEGHKNKTANQQYHAVARYLQDKMRKYCLDTTYHYKCGFESTNHGKISQENFQRVGNRFTLMCRQCCENNVYSPVAIGRLAQHNGLFGIDIKQVFFHDNSCCGRPNEPGLAADRLGQYCGSLDYWELFRGTYAKTERKINGFDPSITSPPGMEINNGAPNHRSDNRGYEKLPSEHYDEIDSNNHNNSMLRLTYFMASCLNVSDEMAPYRLNSRVLKRKASKGEQNDIMLMEEWNPNCHLYLNDVSLIFGGHSLSGTTDPIPQPLHMDFAAPR